ncbi:MAG: hypothetical protein Q7J84_15930 [Sulfuricaulis sp.]|nr:hypothetical protein [Sulfuricaulis sp.]
MADFFIRKGDRLPAIEAELSRQGKVADLTLASSVQLIYQPEAGGVVVTRAAQIVSALLGTVKYSWAAEDTATVGIFLIYFQVTWPGGILESFPNRAHNKFSVTPIFG